ncbi:metallophosphoesterase [Simkania sp.]|uniref:metallophosphoesterase n=1 Tax=Simkania sp. TaxID=34094 RepID=UPI003B5159DF
MLSQIISMSGANWQTAVTCVTANFCCQHLAAKAVKIEDSSSWKNNVISDLVGFLMGAAFVYAIAKPLKGRFLIPINPQAIVPITLFHAMVHFVAKVLFPQKPETPAPVETEEETPAKPELNSLGALVNYFDSKWDTAKKEYLGIEYDPERIKKHLHACTAAKYDLKCDFKTHHGFIEKKEVPKGSKVFVRADLHGDLKSLLENLKAMQRKGLLDENFKCKPGTYMVFCGDYMDRGNYSMEIAEILAVLQTENPDQVYLVRGNHEYLQTNYAFCDRSDGNFVKFIKDHYADLEMFYRTMPLTVYLAEEGGEYVDFTHGLFELHIDPSEMLDSKTVDRMYIPKTSQEFSERVQQLAARGTPVKYNAFQHLIGWKDHEPSKTELAAKRIVDLKATEFDRTIEDTTVYNWGDVTPGTPPNLGQMGWRKWHIRPEDVKDALRMMGNARKVKLLFRGQQHRFQHGSYNGKVVVTTLPVGADTGYYQRAFGGQPDRAYILDIDQKVKNWKKQAFIRKTGETEVEITKAFEIFSEAV